MPIFLFTLVVFFARVSMGSTVPTDSVYLQKIIEPWAKETVENTRGFFSQYKYILLVSIDKDRWESHEPPILSVHHFYGHLVRVYKGNWKASKQISFFDSLDGPAPYRAHSTPRDLRILFTNKPTQSEFGVDTGELLPFKAELEPALLYFYP